MPARVLYEGQSDVRGPGNLESFTSRLFFFKMACKQNLDLRCVLISDPSTLSARAKTRPHTPKAVTYHEQPHYCRFMIGHSLRRIESRIKKFAPHCVCRYGQTEWNMISFEPDFMVENHICVPRLCPARLHGGEPHLCTAPLSS